MACSTNNDFTKSVDMVYKRAQFELRDDRNGRFADVFELRLVFVEVRDSHGLRPVRSGNRRRHWEGSLVTWCVMVTFTVTVNLEPFIRLAQCL